MITATRTVLKAKISALCNGRIPSDLEFADMLRLASEPDSEKLDASNNDPDHDIELAVSEEGASDAHSDNDEGDVEDEEDVTQDYLDRQLEKYITGPVNGDQFHIGSLVGTNDALANMEAGIFGDSDED